MKKVGVAILGLGVVGGGTYKILVENREQYRKYYDVDINVECVLELRRERAIELGVEEDRIYSSIAEVCSNPDVDIVVEVMGGIEPAKSFVLCALNAGKAVVTSNKELYCKFGYELEKAARKNNTGIFYEATCVGGVPVIRSLLDNLQGNNILSIMGIINGTTNYILTKMSQNGTSYDEALKEAQSLGYAEAKPEADVDGYDAVYKLSILSSLAFHTKVPYEKIFREGITDISVQDIQYGKQLGYSLKLMAIGKWHESGIEVRVHPAFIKNDHPLASVNDNYNAVYITGDSVEDIMLYGKGAGAAPTGSAVVGDIIYCATHDNFNYSPFKNTENADKYVRFIENFKSSYYIRINATDKSGVLSKVALAFSRQGISVARMVQEDAKGDSVPMVLVTHPTREHNIKRAVDEINSSPEFSKVVSIIRVVD